GSAPGAQSHRYGSRGGQKPARGRAPLSRRPFAHCSSPGACGGLNALFGTERRRLLIRLLQKPFHKPIGAATVGEGKMPRQVARRRGEIEALVLLIAAGERGAREIPS